MSMLRSQLQCFRRSHFFSIGHYRKLYTSSSRFSDRRFLWYALGGITTSTIAIILFTRPQSSKARELSPFSFIPTSLSSSEEISKNSKLIRLNLPAGSFPKSNPPKAIWAVYVKDSDIMVERSYTPLEGLSASGDMLFWIKRYPHGEVGRWIHSKVAGDQVELRGPEGTWVWQEGVWDNVIMIAGGTGIAPFYQLLYGVFSEKDFTSGTNFRLLHSHRSTELPPTFVTNNLDSWSKLYPENLKVEMFVDNIAQPAASVSLREGKFSKSSIETALNETVRQSGRTIVLVCGPESMVNELAGPKGRDGTQGPVGGVLSQIRGHKFEVFKL